MQSLLCKFVVFSLVFSAGYLAQAAACPAGWTYFPKQKACQYYAPNTLAINCTTVATRSWKADQTCVKVGNCRQHFISSCTSVQSDCRKDIAKKCNNNAECIKNTKCPAQFVVEGVNMSVSPTQEKVVQPTKPAGGGFGAATAKGSGSGTGTGQPSYSGGLGTGEGY